MESFYEIVVFVLNSIYELILEYYGALILYGLLVVLLILPFTVGLIVISYTLLISIKLPNALDLISPSEFHDPTVSLAALSPKAHASAVVLQFLRKQHNEYYLQSVSSSNNIDGVFPLSLLKMLYKYWKPYTTASMERVLVVMPPLQALVSLLKKTGVSKHQPLEHAHPQKRSHSRLFTNKHKGSMEVESSQSSNRLSYFDVSLRKYWTSPQNFYKEKKPIYFKFLSDA